MQPLGAERFIEDNVFIFFGSSVCEYRASAFNRKDMKGNKYWAKSCVYKGMKFPSYVERDRYMYLEYMAKIGEISCLHSQWRFEIMPKITKVVPVQLKTKVRYEERVVESAVHYTCDTIYEENGRYVIEDVKSEYGRKGSRDYPLRRHRMVEKIKDHNARGRGQWIFREAVLCGNQLKIKDYEP